MAIFNTVPPLKAGAGIKFDGERISTAAAPRNLLDNSDFRDPVNQRGSSSYNQNGYTIDRWYLYEENNNARASINDGFILVESLGNNPCQFVQYFEKGILNQNKTYVLVYKEVDGPVTVINSPIWFREMHDQCTITISPGTNKKIEWAALYEGDYTAETLPEYQPKGYVAELAECQRYYAVCEVLVGTAALAPQRLFVMLPQPMRLVPTITYKLSEGSNPSSVISLSRIVIDVTAEQNTYSWLIIRLSADL